VGAIGEERGEQLLGGVAIQTSRARAARVSPR
jgi:hypothetical protein